MSTAAGKDKILNQNWETPMMKVDWTADGAYDAEIRKRCRVYVNDFMKSRDVIQTFHEINREIHALHEKVSNEMLGLKRDLEKKSSSFDPISTAGVEALAKAILITSPITVPLLVALTVGAVGVSVALSPILGPVYLYLKSETHKKNVIDEEYEKFKSNVENLIINQLKSQTGYVIEKLIDKVTNVEIPRELNAIREMNRQLLCSQQDLQGRKGLFINLQRKLEEIEIEANKFS